ncbi:hypothetical protein DIU31_009490 [Mucilaginibacter rubeus]|uniref:Uncharacterized protein n=1 Tax=Mucilaginibacter rubeus TaxID=2027860 RepID=A0AAE6JDJ1_9SPHI|nr:MULTISPECIES: hypothetical protein [Mucilaginibacter]QEM03734.1 hypothetical protein DIU31_009490 [Mucilaginibacter rubeus]QEM16345.1 hypothetical protein DIU38_009585 [Mucilaginibacter gossypii]QTE40888.1 hypothetical protein J3L19_18170 [Mucilaginibacter rubeus]QTE47491.1 hypothetical protein J3L21_18145 [Mucilaginibacter rubeus]QTE58883.1 hypothetical protein J3L23_09810 [Mucilaginibacter rubeus]
MTRINFSEKEIQEHIWKYKDDFYEIIGEFELPPLYQFNHNEQSIEELTSDKILFNIIIERIRNIFEDLQSLRLFGNEVSLGNIGETKIRADFLGKAEGIPGIYIVELKKDGQTERQAFTELLAYANQINAKFPSHSRDDNVFILICPMYGKTIEDAFLQSLVFDKRKICILHPIFEDENEITSLKLKPHIPSLEDIIHFSSNAFKKRNFDVLVYSWNNEETHWNPKPEGQNIVDMNRVAGLAAQLMEEKGIHGFVYPQQQWPEFNNLLPNTNKLVLVGLNPYKIASDNYFRINNPELEHLEPPSLFEINDEINLTNILPGLGKHNDIHTDWNYFTDLGYNWVSNLHHIGQKAVEACTINRMGVKIHSEGVFGGSFDQYESSNIESVYVFQYDLRPTGVIRELYWEVTRHDYTHWSKYGSHPFYGDAFGWAIENTESYLLFETFLRIMFYGRDNEADIDDEDIQED